MPQQTHDVDTDDLAALKAAWTTPAIETYDVAEFTLGAVDGAADGGASQS